ncbi:MAG: hotdog fold thioesterase [Gammaproteobacteria bacterium]
MTTDTNAATLWRPEATLEYMRERMRQTLADHVGIELTEVGADFIVGTMPVDHRTCQPMRVLHGGASVVLAETLGSLAANAANQDTTRRFVGQEINANHLRPVPEGSKVTGVAKPVHIGKSSQVWSIEIRNERGQLTCISRITMAAISV